MFGLKHAIMVPNSKRNNNKNLTTMTHHYQFSTQLDWVTHAQWQVPDTPFMQFTFWQALTNAGLIGEHSDWPVTYVQVFNATSILVAVMPVFIKNHHQGEYVFDFSWAEAFERYGRHYYPRLVTSVPFTPVTGERIWVAQGQSLTQEIYQTLLQAIDDVAKRYQASTWHGLFFSPQSAMSIQGQRNICQRISCQFLWQNRNLDGQKFTQFADFLATLTAKKRKSIKVERQKVAQQNLTCELKLGHDISGQDWEIFYQCYAMTYLVRGRRPYLTLPFFKQLRQSMADHLMLAQACNEHGEVVACSLFFYDETTLYGRYWGCLAEYDCLHFELCYYQGIEFAIQQGLTYFDPGTQGEHKLIRGFYPVFTHSLHRIYEPVFAPAIAQFCEDEQQAVLAYQADAMTVLPFNDAYTRKFFGDVVPKPLTTDS